VQVVDDQSKVKSVIVKPLDTVEGLRVLESGLNEGDRVIVKGIQLVRPGQVVKVEEADLATFRRTEGESGPTDPLESPLIRIRGSEPASPREGAATKPEAGAGSPANPSPPSPPAAGPNPAPEPGKGS
jgi:hypothetical protein